jgi:TolB-like protein
VAPVLDLPPWVARAFLLLLVIGLPIALLFIWMRELAPADAAAPRAAVSKIDYVLIGALVVVLLFMGYQQIAPSSEAPRQAGVDAAKEAAASPRAGISLAVLPFANLSGDPSQEFFSDGITEEITAALARVPDLRVVARTSAYQFRDQNRDIQSIGQQLRATHFIEGSVRKAGDRVRITAQLIRADDATHIWAETFDRELTDVFAIQEDIATSIAGALRMPLGLRPGENLVNNRAIDPDSYQQFLRAKAVLLRGRGAAPDMIAILEPLVARNPNYAPAWADLAHAYYYAATANVNDPEEDRRVRETYVPKMEAAARRAVALDPNSVKGHFFQAIFQTGPRKWALIEDALSKALTLDPTSPEVLDGYSNVVLLLGRVKDAVAMKRQLRELEPFIPIYAGNLAQALWLDGQTEAAIAILKENLGRVGSGAGRDLPQIYASLGRYQEAADVLSQFPGQLLAPLVPTAAPLLRSAPAKVPAPETLPPLGRLGFIYLYIGAPERALDFYEQGAADVLDRAYLWHPSYAPLRKMERFKAIVRQQGLVEYWRERGWPEFCRPVGPDDFACE